jgi:transcriptional regulator with XRE-family HTH domain
MDDIKTKFGKKIKELRLEKGLSQEGFAFKCNLDRTYISGLESGRRNVSLIVLEKISIGLNMCLSKIFENV